MAHLLIRPKKESGLHFQFFQSIFMIIANLTQYITPTQMYEGKGETEWTSDCTFGE